MTTTALVRKPSYFLSSGGGRVGGPALLREVASSGAGTGKDNICGNVYTHLFCLAGFADENVNPISSTPAGDFGESKWGGDQSGGQFEPTFGAGGEGNDSKCRKYVSSSPGKLYEVYAADRA